MLSTHLTRQLKLALFIVTISTAQIKFEDADGHSDFSSNDSCVTTDNKIGKCVRWIDCISLRHLTNWNRLQSHICGSPGKQAMVCCSMKPKDPDFFLTATDTTRWQKKPTEQRQPLEKLTNDSVIKYRILPKKCGITLATDTRVVGGQEAEKGGWPWMAVIFVKKKHYEPFPYCGGSLVTDRHVITAAHCVVTGRNSTIMFPRKIIVRLGAHNLSHPNETDAIDIRVKKIRVHEQYDPRTYKNDIAVLRLSRPVHFSDHISPVCLPYDSLQNEDISGKSASVTGFGATAFNGPSSDVLMEANFAIWDQEQCRRAYESGNNFTNAYLCAGPADGSKDSCQGDSGGPLVTVGKKRRFYLIGVASFGYRCAEPGYPGVYTRVTEFLDWLAINLAK